MSYLFILNRLSNNAVSCSVPRCVGRTQDGDHVVEAADRKRAFVRQQPRVAAADEPRERVPVAAVGAGAAVGQPAASRPTRHQ